MPCRLLAAAGALLLGAFVSTPLGPAGAQQRTRLTVYTAIENEQLQPFKAAAEAALRDIEIAWVRDSTGVITARLVAERAQPRADVIWGLSAFSLLGLEALDMLEPFTPNGAEILRPNMRSDRSPMTWTGMDAFVAAICYNTAVARQRNLPRPSTWTDLLNPALRGQIAMPNPSSSGTGFLTVAGWMATMGEQPAWTFMNGLHENIQVYTHSGSAPCNNAARGEYGLGISLDMRAVTLRNQGAPIEIIVPTDGVGFDLEATAILRGTRNLAAARRLAGFAVTRAAMELYGRYYAILALPDVAPAVQGYPADFEQRLATINIREMGAQRDRILAEWTRRFDGKSAPR
ncbi:MAG: putative 2-aminoethylphosphonate transporter substrate-binding protein [Rubritepida sp.]|nr:putative 2-aminoethylphosphonate transporter substrate-binding protein [Rubritepida sp.]